MAWWLWILVGLALLAFEMTMPGGLFALFFGFGALVVGGLTAAGASGPTFMQWLLFTVLSVAALAVLRGRLRASLALRSAAVDPIVGETAVSLGDLSPQDVGKAELRGTPWEARNAASVAITAGQRCRVQRVEGLTIWIVPQ